MNVVGVTEYGNDFCYAVLKQQETLDPEFAAKVKQFHGWEDIEDDELLDAQTFVSWYLSSRPKQSVEDAINNEQFAWEGLELWGGGDETEDEEDKEGEDE